MDRKSCRARKSVAVVASVAGLAAALALAVPTAASAAHHDRNCGNFDHTDQMFGAPFDGHHRHRAHPVHAVDGEQQAWRDHDGDEDGDGPDFAEDGDHDGEHHGDLADDRRDDRRDDRAEDHREPAFHDGEISRDEGGNRNCNNFDHKGKQMNIPPGLFDAAHLPAAPKA